MKKLILFFVVLLIVGCSKDDEGESFLDKYDGTSWMVEEEEDIDGGEVEVITFSNGTYLYGQVIGGGPIPGAIDDCFQFKEGTNVISGLEMTTVTNSKI